MTSAIYAIVNNITCDMYVGSAVALNKRWNAHKSNLRNNKHHCLHLQNAFAKYGAAAFDWEVIETVADKTKLLQREQFWLDFFQPAYNKRKVADSCFGIKRSLEARNNMRAAQLGKKQTPETIAKRAAALRGVPRPPEVRAKISASHMGIRPTAESRRKMSESAKRRGLK